MGIWSEYKQSTTRDVKVNMSNLKKPTIEWIICKGKNEQELKYPEMTIQELGESFCDTAKIWGYMEDADGPLNDIAANIDADYATMIFSSDADNINYYMLRFDKFLKKYVVLVHKTKDYPEKIEDINWVEKKDSEIFREMHEAAKKYLLMPGLSEKDRDLFLRILR